MDLNQIACVIIANAGEAQSYAMEAIEKARENDFVTSLELLSKSEESLLIAHNAHTQILVQEANADQIAINFLLVHASNHLSEAKATKEMAMLFMEILKEVRNHA